MAQNRKDYPVRNLVVGRVVSPSDESKKTVGYVVISFNDYSSNFMIMSIPLQALLLKVSRGEIENAVLLETHAISLQGVNEKDLPITYVGQKQPVVDGKVMVLDRVVRKEKGREISIGFRVFTYTGIVFVSADKLIEAHNSNKMRSINAKVVTRDGKDILSSKRGNFGVILEYRESKPSNTQAKQSTPSLKKDLNASDVLSENKRKLDHKNYRKKVVEYFVTHFVTSGRVRKIKSDLIAKKAKIALSEFFVKKFPELVELKNAENHLILEAAVVLFLSSPEGKNYPKEMRKLHLVSLEDQKIELGSSDVNRVFEFLSNSKREVSQDILNYLALRNKLLGYLKTESGRLPSAEFSLVALPLIESELEKIKDNKDLYSKYVAGIYEFWQIELKRIIRNKKRKEKELMDDVLVSDVDFTSPEGFYKMGYALLGDNMSGTEYDSVFGRVKLRSMFDLGFEGLKVAVPTDVQKQIVSNITTFGDTEIVRSLLVLKFALNNDLLPVSDIKAVMNVRLAVLSRYNYSLASVMNQYLDEVATFSLRDVSVSPHGGESEHSRVFYETGMKFNNPNIIISERISWESPKIKDLPRYDKTPRLSDKINNRHEISSANTMPSDLIDMLNSHLVTEQLHDEPIYSKPERESYYYWHYKKVLVAIKDFLDGKQTR